MMKRLNFSFLVFSLIIFFVQLSSTGYAQPGDPGGGDPDAPITGIEILLVSGGILGIKKIVDSRKKK